VLRSLPVDPKVSAAGAFAVLLRAHKGPARWRATNPCIAVHGRARRKRGRPSLIAGRRVREGPSAKVFGPVLLNHSLVAKATKTFAYRQGILLPTRAHPLVHRHATPVRPNGETGRTVPVPAATYPLTIHALPRFLVLVHWSRVCTFITARSRIVVVRTVTTIAQPISIYMRKLLLLFVARELVPGQRLL
jgi:hypothetical protein